MPPIPDPRTMSPSVFLNNLRHFEVNEENGHRLLGAVIGKAELDPLKWASAGIIKRKAASQLAPLPKLGLESILTSPSDGFKKLIFSTYDDLKVETVIIPLHKPGRVSVCLSSQVGCVMGCTFCATARMPRRRNLQSWEIIDQMHQAREVAIESGRRVSGAVFMGMGEPFLNYENVLTAAELLSYPVANAVRSKAITISTVGLVNEINRYTAEKRPYRLSISLGAATDEKRRMLVPVAARKRGGAVMQGARSSGLLRKVRVMISYVCISGVNIFDDDAKALAVLIGDTRVRMDLIDVTDNTGHYKKPTEGEIKSFRNALNVYLKQPVVRRYSGGSDINAACGTLSGGMSPSYNI